MSDDTWAGLADQFADETYASVKGSVRTYVMHRQPENLAVLVGALQGPPDMGRNRQPWMPAA